MPEALPALAELHERLKVNNVHVDPRHVASALLGIARLNQWTENPERVVEWLEQLALDVARSVPSER
jgi:hypothetical protein